MIFLRSLVFNICFTGWALLSSVMFAPLFLISSQASLAAARPWAKGVLWLARVILGITHEVRGEEYISYQPVIYASKHQSAWDTAVFLILLRHPAYVLKKSLLRLPGWGWYLWRMRMIAIDRKAGASTMKRLLRQAKERLAEGRAIIIYPEGTRTKPGAMPNYHPGVAALYGLNVPVVPVALNSGCFWGKNAFLKHPGRIVIEFLPPIAPGMKRDAFMSLLQERIETASQKLLEESKRS